MSQQKYTIFFNFFLFCHHIKMWKIVKFYNFNCLTIDCDLETKRLQIVEI